MSHTNYPRQLQQLGLSNLEAPGKITSISLEKLFTIADVLNVSPASLLSFD